MANQMEVVLLMMERHLRDHGVHISRGTGKTAYSLSTRWYITYNKGNHTSVGPGFATLREAQRSAVRVLQNILNF